MEDTLREKGLVLLTVAVWLAFRVAICNSYKFLATMLPLEGCTDDDLWEDTSPASADAQSMARFFSELKLLPLGVCTGRLSQPRLASRFCAEMSRPCFGVSVGVGGKQAVPWLLCIVGTNSADAGAGDCAEAGGGVTTGSLSLASGVVEAVAVAEGVFFRGSVCCRSRSFRCSFWSSSFFFCGSSCGGCCTSGGGWRRGDCCCWSCPLAGGDLSVPESGTDAPRLGVGVGPEAPRVDAAGSETPAVVCSSAACVDGGVTTGASCVGGGTAAPLVRGSIV